MNEKEIVDKLKDKKFKYIISLGFFCSVAHDLEELGLRSCSGPVDWVWSTWSGVYESFKTQFADFLEYDNLEQARQDGCIYRDKKHHIVFFHDFSKYKSLEKQFSKVKFKYSRRIARFYENITEPTLFVRYIWNGEYRGGKINEIRKIEKDYFEFLQLIKSYNKENEIIFIANDDISSDILPIFYVSKDENDTVNRKPIFGNRILVQYFNEMDFENRERNLNKYRKKCFLNSLLVRRGIKKMDLIIHKYFFKEYKYEKQYDHGEYVC